MYRFVVVLLTVAAVKGQYDSFGYKKYGGISSLDQEELYPQPLPLEFEQFKYQPKFGFDSDSSQFESGKSGQSLQQFAARNGRKGDEFEESSNGFKRGNEAERRANAASGFFSDENGDKRFADDAKQYFGNKQFSKEGQNEARRKANSGHKRGRVVKGFKKSHHLDEDGRSENYFDEANDEGENFNINGQSGSFGEKELASFKGAAANSAFRGNRGGQRQRYENEQSLDRNEGNNDQYAARKFGANNSNFGASNNGEQESFQGRSSGSKFSKKSSY